MVSSGLVEDLRLQDELYAVAIKGFLRLGLLRNLLGRDLQLGQRHVAIGGLVDRGERNMVRTGSIAEPSLQLSW